MFVWQEQILLFTTTQVMYTYYFQQISPKFIAFEPYHNYDNTFHNNKKLFGIFMSAQQDTVTRSRNSISIFIGISDLQACQICQAKNRCEDCINEFHLTLN